MSFNFVHFATHAAGRWSEVGRVERGRQRNVLAQDNTNFAYDSYYKCFLSACRVVLRKMSSAASSAASSAGSRSRYHFALIPQMKSYCCDFSAPSTLPFFLLMPWESILVTANNNNNQPTTTTTSRLIQIQANQKHISAEQARCSLPSDGILLPPMCIIMFALAASIPCKSECKRVGWKATGEKWEREREISYHCKDYMILIMIVMIRINKSK